MTKIEMAQVIVQALRASGIMPEDDHSEVMRIARFKLRRLQREYEAALHILEQRRKRGELTSENFRGSV